ncbi:hypothetical protein ACFQ09_03705 [Massilia norwichensis]|uniref:Outer membrane protein beta-barrel domain-containing protein n=1 Tax=Massilia norwichensis TaxID=1442366 RepID=A0ABT2AEJ4_9BURK|nr:hypothetical protein [Massilia norwichensis]MCS0592640.1 hypothetical protein [Massilia norwichensis]
MFARHSVLAIAAVLASGAACAQQSPALDRMSISAGVFSAKPKIHAAGDTSQGYLSTPDAEGSHTTLPRVKAEVLLGDSQGLALDYWRYDKDYNPTIAGASTIDGRPVSGTATVNANLRLDLAQLAYRWWLGRGNDVFGVGVGAAYLHAKVSGEGRGQVTGVSGLPQTVEFNGRGQTSESGYAPLVELAWRHSFNEQLRLVAEASGVKKNGGNVDGHVYGGTIGLEWFPARNVGVVVDYGMQRIQLSRNGEREADLKLRLSGPSAYVKLRF